VVAIKYADGVMMASDTLASYGGMARFTNVVRLHPVGHHTLIGCTGDLSDFDRVKEHLHELLIEDVCQDDGACRLHRPCMCTGAPNPSKKNIPPLEMAPL
jgi:20S proteasome subunit beta 7